MLKNFYGMLFLALSMLISFGASATTVYDGITTAVTQPLVDAGTVIVSIAGLAAVLVIVYKVAKMLLGFVRSF